MDRSGDRFLRQVASAGNRPDRRSHIRWLRRAAVDLGERTNGLRHDPIQRKVGEKGATVLGADHLRIDRDVASQCGGAPCFAPAARKAAEHDRTTILWQMSFDHVQDFEDASHTMDNENSVPRFRAPLQDMSKDAHLRFKRRCCSHKDTAPARIWTSDRPALPPVVDRAPASFPGIEPSTMRNYLHQFCSIARSRAASAAAPAAD